MIGILVGTGTLVVAGVYVAAFAMCRAAARADALLEAQRTIVFHDLPTVQPAAPRDVVAPRPRKPAPPAPRRLTRPHRAAPNVGWAVLHDEVFDMH